ncbi:MAG: hypothetical protein JRN56_01950 [Nitrososphaerota archaeon]|nr:hypothetical protein [Nitrososphaerota archaeon]MDG6903781.1 hypothetical protein [Nitrososphaerota archaeon]MDG6911586.1 hypothetical protein [Nitrososphaerota archaeon]MDG6940490.1 hypothetical protein [Nitrososphaerota archaeon]MDG6960801.1 hypothetical protein [Nitrososphaerota archaeon]
MKIGTRAATYGLAGLALAGAIIVSGSSFGLFGSGSSGVLSVLFTDPPTVPTGVTGVYITYSNLAVHAAGFGNSGWISVPGHGTFDSMKLVNLSQMVSSDTVPPVTYDKMGFTITTATVQFVGQNYTAIVSTGRMDIPIIGGLKVNSTSPAAAIVDVQPTVINLGNNSSPIFTLAAGAKALQVPSEYVSQLTKTMGQQVPLKEHGWFDSFKAEYSNNFSGTAVSLTPNSFSINVENGGPSQITVRMLIVAAHIKGGEGSALSAAANSMVFLVQPNGSLQLLGGPLSQVQSYLNGPGYTLAGGSSQTFSYSGSITSLRGGSAPIVGTSYYVVIVGTGTISAQLVTAT